MNASPYCADDSKEGRYRKMNMAHVCWNEIGLRVGSAAKNVYCHQGCCEHLLVIKDVRTLHPDDSVDLDSYPLLIREVGNLLA